MAGKNVINKVIHNLATNNLQPDINSKLLCNDKLNRSYDWFFLDSEYTEREIMKNIQENR